MGTAHSQSIAEAPYHAELCFLSWFRAQNLSPDENYHVTWFSSWSPCHTCADEVVKFLDQYRNVTLDIFAARLYCFWDPPFQNGLRELQSAGVQLDIMSFEGDSRRSWDRAVGGSRTRAEVGSGGGSRASLGRVSGRRAWETEARTGGAWPGGHGRVRRRRPPGPT